MNHQHTPGPWAVSRIGNHYDQYAVHQEGSPRDLAHSIDGIANATLIASAPAMLAALEQVLESMGDYYDAGDAAGDEGRSLHDLVEQTIYNATHP